MSDVFSPKSMGNGVGDRTFMMEIAFDHQQYMKMMLDYGLRQPDSWKPARDKKWKYQPKHRWNGNC